MAAVLFLGALLAIYTYDHLKTPSDGRGLPPPAARTDPAAAREGERAIVEAYREERSGLWVESAGLIERLLSDDLEGSRHQRFIVRLSNGHTLLISHNIDLAPRIPASAGDPVAFRGEYEWNDRGGVVHWTHHDPRGNLQGGWIRHGGELYR